MKFNWKYNSDIYNSKINVQDKTIYRYRYMNILQLKIYKTKTSLTNAGGKKWIKMNVHVSDCKTAEKWWLRKNGMIQIKVTSH